MNPGTNSIAFLSIAFAIVFCLLVVGAHWDRRDDLRPLSASLSTYFAGSSRSTMFFAYASLAIALLCVSVSIATISDVPYRWLATALCVVSACCLIPIGLTARRLVGDPDVRSQRTITLHRFFALGAFLLIVGAMSAYAAGVATQGLSSSGTMVIVIVTMAAIVNFAVVLGSRPGPTYGLKQKGLTFLVVIWIAIVATQLTLPPAVH